MNLTAVRNFRALSVEITRSRPIIYMSERQHSMRRKMRSRKHSKAFAACLGITTCTSCFPFELTEVSAFYFVTSYNQVREQTLVGAPWSNCDHHTSQRSPFYPFSFSPSSQDPSSIPPANFRSNLLRHRLRQMIPRKNGRSFSAAEMDTWVFRSFIKIFALSLRMITWTISPSLNCLQREKFFISN